MSLPIIDTPNSDHTLTRSGTSLSGAATGGLSALQLQLAAKDPKLQENFFRLLLKSFQKDFELDLLSEGFTRLLKAVQKKKGSFSLLPGPNKSSEVNYQQELLILLWQSCSSNPKFVSRLIARCGNELLCCLLVEMVNQSVAVANGVQDQLAEQEIRRQQRQVKEKIRTNKQQQTGAKQQGNGAVVQTSNSSGSVGTASTAASTSSNSGGAQSIKGAKQVAVAEFMEDEGVSCF